jgi:RHS repeat-associated protein
VKSVINGVTTIYIGDYFEWSGSTSTMKRYYYAGGERVAMRSGSTLYFLLGDHLGSTSVTATSSGSLHSRQLYKPWGENRWNSGTVPTTFRFTGQRQEASLGGLYDYRARFYDPSIMQFNQPDTLIPDPYHPLDWNCYAYVRYNPLKYVDPSGISAKWSDQTKFVPLTLTLMDSGCPLRKVSYKQVAGKRRITN